MYATAPLSPPEACLIKAGSDLSTARNHSYGRRGKATFAEQNANGAAISGRRHGLARSGSGGRYGHEPRAADADRRRRASKYEQKQSQIGAAVSVITREEIKAFGWRTLDQALASLPGVYVTYDRQFTYLGVRGFGLPGDYNTRVLVTINGNRVNDPIFDSGPSGRELPIDMDLIERIEFIPGPGGAVYGQNAMFAVVNIVTRKGTEVNGAELAVGYQQPQSLIEGRASYGAHFDNGVDVLMSVSGMNAQGQNLFFNYGASGKSGIAWGLDGDRTKQFFGSIARGPWSFEVVSACRSPPLPPTHYRVTNRSA